MGVFSQAVGVAALEEICLLDCFLATAFKEKYNEIIAKCQTNTHTHIAKLSRHAECQMQIHKHPHNITHTHIHTLTDGVQKPHIHTQKPLALHKPHSCAHDAVHTSSPLVQTQTPHASAPRSMSHRPQE